MVANQKEVNYIISNKKTVRSIWRNGNLMYFYGGPNKLTSPWTQLPEEDNIKYFQRLRIWAQPSTTSWKSVEGELPTNTYGLMVRFHNYVFGPNFQIYKDSTETESLLGIGSSSEDRDAANIYLTLTGSVNKIELSTPAASRNNTYGVILYIYRTAPKSSNKLQVDVMEYMNGLSNILSTKHYSFTDTQDLLRPEVGGYYSTTISALALNGITTVVANAYYQLKGTQKTKLILGNTGDIQTSGYYVYGDSFTPEGTDISNVKVTTTAHHASVSYNSSANTISCTIYSTASGPVDAAVTYYSVP